MDFDSESIASLAADIGDGISGARLHGAMVGGLCGGGADGGVWEPVLEAALGDAPIGAWEPELRQMLSLTEAALADPEYTFEPMLPDAGEPLADRVQALADWCDAFVLAYAAIVPAAVALQFVLVLRHRFQPSRARLAFAVAVAVLAASAQVLPPLVPLLYLALLLHHLRQASLAR